MPTTTRTTLRAAAVLTLATATVAIALPAHAAPDVTLPNGCTIVGDPTSSNHTVCRDLVFGPGDVATGANLDYADLSGSTITSDLLAQAASARALVLDDVDYRASTPLLAAGIPGSIASAARAVLGDPAGYSTVFAGSPESPIDLRGADLSGATIRGWAVYLDATGADLSGAQLGHPEAFSSQVLFGDFTGANLSGATFAEGMAGGPADHDFTGATVIGLTLPRSIGGSIMAGIDWTVATFRSGSTFGGADLSGAVLEGITFEGQVHWGGVKASGLRAAGVTFAGGLDAGGVDLTDADLSRARLVDAWLAGAEALRADFTDATFSGSLNLAGANLTSTRWVGAKGLDTVTGPYGGEPSGILPGASLAHADLTGVTLPLSSGMWLTDVTAPGATFLVSNPWTGQLLFHDADLTGATFTGGGGLGGSQFHRAKLAGAVLDVGLDGAVFVDADMRGAAIQPTTLRGVGGLTIIDSTMTGATLPPVQNDPGAPQRWMYGLKLVGADLTGTSLAPLDVETTTLDLDPVPVTFTAGPGWANDADQDPFHADGSYWWGAKLLCDHDSGALFPVGRTTVSCQVGFDHQINSSPTDWSTTIFDPSWDGTGPFAFEAPGTSVPERASNPPPDATFSWFAAAAGRPDQNSQADLVSAYAYRSTWHSYASDQVTTVSAPMNFTVDVNSPPRLTAAAANGVVGRPLDAAATATGWPRPSITVHGLPTGVTWTQDPASDGLEATGQFTGTPAPGQGGWHDLEVTATNTAGTDTTTVRVWIVEPAADLTHDGEPVFVGADLTVTGTGFTPTGQVQILDHHGVELDVVAATAEGSVSAHSYAATETGTVYFELVDQTTSAAARTLEATIVAPATDPGPQPEPEPDHVDEDEPVDDDPVTDDEPDTEEPDELGETGVDGIAVMLLVTLGALAAGIGLWCAARPRAEDGDL